MESSFYYCIGINSKNKMEKCYIGKSNIHGKGIIAACDLNKDEKLFHIKGKIIDFVVKNKKDALSGPLMIGYGKNKWIDPDDFSKYLNHSCNPSCGIKGRITLIAMRNIKKGEEITIDYSITEMEPLWEMKCKCGAKQCRKIIKSVQFLPLNLFKKYNSYIPTLFSKYYIKHNGLQK